MALDNHYIPAFFLENIFLDKDTGAPLSGGVLTFYEDIDRLTPKSMFQLSGTPPNYTYIDIGPTITLNSIGACAIDDDPFVPYFFPYDAEGDLQLYYMTCESSAGTAQFSWEAMPYVGTTGAGGADTNIENDLSNTQFSEVLFGIADTSYPITLASSTTLAVAPGWDLILTGAGTVTLKQITLVPSAITTNPPYALDIALSGFTGSARLRQYLLGNPSLWCGRSLNGFFVANATTASAVVQMQYVQDSGAPSEVVVVNASVAVGSYTAFTGSIELDASTNSSTAPAGWCAIDFVIPNGAHVALTSIQTYSSIDAIADTDIVFNQEPLNRLEDHLAHYYKPQLAYKPIPSYTIGWDFRYNPCQELGRTVAAINTGANGSVYIADQTILFQTVTSAIAAAFGDVNGIDMSVSSATSWAIIQYLDTTTALELLKQRLCVHVRGKSSAPTGPISYVNLYWTAGALPNPTTPSFDSLVTSITAGVPAVVAGWNKISRGGLNSATFQTTNTLTDFSFSGWDATAAAGIDTATYFAIVVSFDTYGALNHVNLSHVTLQGGDIPTPPSPLSYSQTLSALEYYYEKSYDQSVLPGANTAAGGLRGALVIPQYVLVTGGLTTVRPTTFSLSYRTPKRTIPAGTNYDPGAGTLGNVIAAVNTDGTVTSASVAIAGNWNAAGLQGTKGSGVASASTTALATNASGATINYGYITFQYVSDARLGVI